MSLKNSHLQSVIIAAPAAHRDELVRSRLSQLLDGGMSAAVTLLSAPSGYGKTTVLSHWSAYQQKSYAWLNIHEFHNDPARFLNDFILALQRLHPNLGKGLFAALQSERKPPIEMVLKQLTESLRMLIHPCAIILDDLQRISSPPVLNMISFLIEALPANAHMFFSGQFDPQIPLSELRAKGQVKEIRSPELGFTIDESSALLNDVLKLNLSVGEITGVLQRSKSIPLNLRLAGSALMAASVPGEFLSAFEKDDGEEIPYLVQTLVEGMERSHRQFLHFAALFDTLHKELCHTAIGECETIIETLAGQGVLLAAWSKDEDWYFIHPHIRAVLLKLNEAVDPRAVEEIHQQGALWYQQHGLLEQAFEHALHAGQFRFAANILADHSMEMLQNGQLATVRDWMERLPERQVTETPLLSICQAWMKIINGEPEGIETCLQRALASRENTADPDDITGHVEAIRHYLSPGD